jgi:hypothetical protein
MVIPNKSTIAEEKTTVSHDKESYLRNRRLFKDEKEDGDRGGSSATSPVEDLGGSTRFVSQVSPWATLGGLSALLAIESRQINHVQETDGDQEQKINDDQEQETDDDRLQEIEDHEHDPEPSDRHRRWSTSAPARIGMLKNIRNSKAWQSNALDEEKLQRDYDFKSTTLRMRINNLEADVAESNIEHRPTPVSNLAPRPIPLSNFAPPLLESFSRTSPLCLDGLVTQRSKYIVASGGYADIWTGNLNDKKVAIKTMRGFSSMGLPIVRAKLLKVKASACLDLLVLIYVIC